MNPQTNLESLARIDATLEHLRRQARAGALMPSVPAKPQGQGARLKVRSKAKK